MQRRERPPQPSSDFAAAQRQISIRLIVQSLQGWRHGDPCLRQIASSLERRHELRRQPWRQPVRPDSAPTSVLEKIRQFEARARAH